MVGNEHRLCVAAQACLLLLHRETDYFPHLRTILIYPATYVVPTTRHVGGGIMQEANEHRAGESWREGAIVLAWNEVNRGLAAPEAGYNVILHEFAHQLDYEDGGYADGVPSLGHGESLSMRKRRCEEWRRIMRKEYEALRARVQRGESTFLREYGATSPAEFFAVATEAFFMNAPEMQERHGELYEQLKWYYKQDPEGWQTNEQGTGN